MAGEMLEAAQHAIFLQTLEIGFHHGGSNVRVGGEGTRADDDVAGVGVDVGDGSKIDVKSILGQIFADRRGGLRHVFCFAGGCQLRHVGEFGKMERLVVGKARHDTALLVNAKERM